MLVGIGFVAVLTAAAAERFMRGREAEAQRGELHDRLAEIHEHPAGHLGAAGRAGAPWRRALTMDPCAET
jgi:hypothetical protein